MDRSKPLFLKTVKPYAYMEYVAEFPIRENEGDSDSFYRYLGDKTAIFTLSTNCKACYRVLEMMNALAEYAASVRFVIMLECDNEELMIIRNVIGPRANIIPMRRAQIIKHLRVPGVPWMLLLSERKVVLSNPCQEEAEIRAALDRLAGRESVGAP